ncbi:DUF397 domain-containing protein, partial [Streptomyces microflavus]|uniref:DUF397 domain-containing protein n=1 Tax=Streptomyces microflavus TaxID=1919 RepID=UPI00380E8EE1
NLGNNGAVSSHSSSGTSRRDRSAPTIQHHAASAERPRETSSKSSYSGGNEGQCVELADLAATPFTGQRGIRDSKNPGGPALLIPAESFAAFMAAVKAGTFDI